MPLSFLLPLAVSRTAEKQNITFFFVSCLFFFLIFALPSGVHYKQSTHKSTSRRKGSRPTTSSLIRMMKGSSRLLSWRRVPPWRHLQQCAASPRVSGLSQASVPLHHPRRTVVTHSVGHRTAPHRRGSRVASAGLWSGHQTPAAAPTSPHVPPRHNIQRSSDSSSSRMDTLRRPSASTLTSPVRSAASTRTRSKTVEKSSSEDGGAPSSVRTSFTLDPPFTPVDGEAAWCSHGHADAACCLYACRCCGTVLFDSHAIARGSRVGHHVTGWPTFVSPHTDTAVRLCTVLQRSVVAQASTTPAISTHTTTTTTTTAAAAARPMSTPLQMRVPDAGMVQRGLPIEGDVVRLRGRPITAQHTQTWREACLRDENHRADPAIVLGCCQTCGTPVCQVTQSAAEGNRYVATASRIAARGPSG